LCARAGITGRITLKPTFALTEQEQACGTFAENKVVNKAADSRRFFRCAIRCGFQNVSRALSTSCAEILSLFS
jgi:hypothetical protein